MKRQTRDIQIDQRVGIYVDARIRIPSELSGYFFVLRGGRPDVFTASMIEAHRFDGDFYWVEWELNPYVADKVRMLPFLPTPVIRKEIKTDIDLANAQKQTKESHEQERFSGKALYEIGNKGPVQMQQELEAQQRGHTGADEDLDKLVKDIVLKFEVPEGLLGKPLNREDIENAAEVINNAHTFGNDEDRQIKKQLDKEAREFTKQYRARLAAIKEGDGIPIVKPPKKRTRTATENKLRHQVKRMLLTEEASEVAMNKLGYTYIPAGTGSGRGIITWRSYLTKVMSEKYKTKTDVQALVDSGILPHFPYPTHTANGSVKGQPGRSGRRSRQENVVKSLKVVLEHAGLELIPMEEFIKPF